MTRTVEVDYLVVGAGAMGMAFIDALIDHADVRVAVVDRRHAAGGHWLSAYPFVRLHQASAFYGVASTLLGGGRRQERGPEAGLHERADQPAIASYYSDRLAGMLASGRVEFFGACDYRGHRSFVSRVSGEELAVPERCRVVDARYLSPDIPVMTPPPFDVADGARVIPVNDLALLEEAPSQYVVVGSGKTATDACVWLLTHGVDPDAICWVRPRDPWMFNRAVIQPDPTIFVGMVADLMEAAAAARVDGGAVPAPRGRSASCCASTPRSPRRWPGRRRSAAGSSSCSAASRTSCGSATSGRRVRGRLELEQGTVAIAPDAVVVHCAAHGLKMPELVPVWGPDTITLQPIRTGFPCFGAALVGYVEATREDDAEKNRVCPPSPYASTLAEWARMNVLGVRAAAAFGAEEDIRTWSTGVALNPARVPPGTTASAGLDEARERVAAHTPAGVARLAELAREG